jgi:hypothetical protein
VAGRRLLCAAGQFFVAARAPHAPMGNRPAAAASPARDAAPVASNGWASEEYSVTQSLRSASITGVIQTSSGAAATGRLRMRVDAEALVFLDEERSTTLAAFPYYSIMCWGEHSPRRQPWFSCVRCSMALVWALRRACSHSSMPLRATCYISTHWLNLAGVCRAQRSFVSVSRICDVAAGWGCPTRGHGSTRSNAAQPR